MNNSPFKKKPPVEKKVIAPDADTVVWDDEAEKLQQEKERKATEAVQKAAQSVRENISRNTAATRDAVLYIGDQIRKAIAEGKRDNSDIVAAIAKLEKAAAPPTEWTFTVKRDDNDLITEVTGRGI